MSEDKIKEIRETTKANEKMLIAFEEYLTENLPESKFVLDSLEYLQKYNKNFNSLWIDFYDLHYRFVDMEKNQQNIEKRLKSLENNG